MCDHSSHSCHYATIKTSLNHTNEKPNENDQMNKVVGRKSVYVKFSSIKFAFVLVAPFHYVHEQIAPSLERQVCSAVAVCAPLTPLFLAKWALLTLCLFSLLIYVNFSIHAKIKDWVSLKENSCLDTQNVS